jgi:hypothetical protein
MVNALLQGLCVVFVLTLIFSCSIRPKVVYCFGCLILTLAFANILLAFYDPLFAFDYRIFWLVGRDVIEGLDPYIEPRFREHHFLHPPTALPVFAMFALISFSLSKVIWCIANGLALCVSVSFTQRVLLQQEHLISQGQFGPSSWKMPPSILVGLTGIFAVSTASFTLFATGQLSLLVTIGLLAALDAQSRGRPLQAGLWLALASIKITTLLPFLLLFLRRADLRTWLSFGVGLMVLTFITTPPAKLHETANLLAQHIRELQEPGQVNDVSFQGTQHTTILGLDHALYRLGMRDFGWIQIGQALGLLALTLAVARLVMVLRMMPRAAACSLVAAFSVIFLYHRIYDTMVLVIPLVYCTGWARAAQGPSRWLFAGTAIAIVLVLFLPIAGLSALARYSFESGSVGRLIQAVLLPYATWAVLLTMLGLAVGGFLIKSSQPAKAAIGTQK